MPWDIFDISIVNSVLTDLALGRIWRSGVAITRFGVYVADAATGFQVNFFMGRELVVGPNGRKNGIQWAAGNDDKTLTQIARQNLPGETNVCNAFHTGAAAQTATVVVEYE